MKEMSKTNYSPVSECPDCILYYLGMHGLWGNWIVLSFLTTLCYILPGLEGQDRTGGL